VEAVLRTSDTEEDYIARGIAHTLVDEDLPLLPQSVSAAHPKLLQFPRTDRVTASAERSRAV
jgi:hypothetical protein